MVNVRRQNSTRIQPENGVSANEPRLRRANREEEKTNHWLRTLWDECDLARTIRFCAIDCRRALCFFFFLLFSALLNFGKMSYAYSPRCVHTTTMTTTAPSTIEITQSQSSYIIYRRRQTQWLLPSCFDFVRAFRNSHRTNTNNNNNNDVYRYRNWDATTTTTTNNTRTKIVNRID